MACSSDLRTRRQRVGSLVKLMQDIGALFSHLEGRAALDIDGHSVVLHKFDSPALVLGPTLPLLINSVHVRWKKTGKDGEGDALPGHVDARSFMDLIPTLEKLMHIPTQLSLRAMETLLAEHGSVSRFGNLGERIDAILEGSGGPSSLFRRLLEVDLIPARMLLKLTKGAQ